MRIRRLQHDDERSAFRCGDSDYDDFLHKYAGQNQFSHHVGVTLVAVEDERVLGYATVTPAHVQIDELPESESVRLPRYPVPVLRLARLAVDQRVQGAGIGRALVREVLLLALRMAEELGCVAIVADVLESRSSFYQELGFEPLAVLEAKSNVPGTLAMYLALRKVEAANADSANGTPGAE